MSASCRIAPPASAFSRFSRLPVERLSITATRSPRAINASTRLEPMNPAPPVTRQSKAPVSLPETSRARAAHAQHGPDSKDDPGRAGGRPRPARKGAMLAGPLDFLIETHSISLSGSGKGRIRREKQAICLARRPTAQPLSFADVGARWCPLVELPSTADAAVQGLLRVLTLRFVSVSRPRGIQTN